MKINAKERDAIKRAALKAALSVSDDFVAKADVGYSTSVAGDDDVVIVSIEVSRKKGRRISTIPRR